MGRFDGPQRLPDEPVASFTELIEVVGRRRGSCLFRGHRDADWPLEPNIFRHVYRKAQLAHGLPRMLLEAFKKSAVRFMLPPPNDWEWLAVAQHHGLLTPLLDWTSNPLVGAFFAVEEFFTEAQCLDESEKRVSALWCYWPAQDQLGSLADYYERDASPFEIGKVVIFEPSHYSARIPAQNAVFTVHPFLSGGSSKPKWNGRILKVVIPPGARVEIRRTLFRFGLHRASLFPDLDGAARFINSGYSVAEDEELRRRGAI
jgi:hypothetical protein